MPPDANLGPPGASRRCRKGMTGRITHGRPQSLFRTGQPKLSPTRTFGASQGGLAVQRRTDNSALLAVP
jgi:hypothetical protein